MSINRTWLGFNKDFFPHYVTLYIKQRPKPSDLVFFPFPDLSNTASDLKTKLTTGVQENKKQNKQTKKKLKKDWGAPHVDNDWRRMLLNTTVYLRWYVLPYWTSTFKVILSLSRLGWEVTVRNSQKLKGMLMFIWFGLLEFIFRLLVWRHPVDSLFFTFFGGFFVYEAISWAC